VAEGRINTRRARRGRFLTNVTGRRAIYGRRTERTQDGRGLMPRRDTKRVNLGYVFFFFFLHGLYMARVESSRMCVRALLSIRVAFAYRDGRAGEDGLSPACVLQAAG